MSFATLLFSGRDWLWLAAIVFGAAFLLLFWSYRSTRAGLFGWGLMLLKLLGVAALAFCILEPLWSGQRARPGANLFAIVADNSQGLQIKDRGETRSRSELLRDLLNPQLSQWQGTLQQNFELRRHFFDARLQSTTDFSELNFDGRASAIGAALRSIAERYQGRPLAGILLLTDGNATDIHAAPDLTGLPPVYPVVLGNTEPIKDIAIQQTRVSQSAFEDAPVSVQADVLASGYRGEQVVARLIDQGGKTVSEQSLRPRHDSDTLPFRFQLRPEQAGLSFYELRVRTKSELGASLLDTHSSEATLANNRT